MKIILSSKGDIHQLIISSKDQDRLIWISKKMQGEVLPVGQDSENWRHLNLQYQNIHSKTLVFLDELFLHFNIFNIIEYALTALTFNSLLERRELKERESWELQWGLHIHHVIYLLKIFVQAALNFIIRNLVTMCNFVFVTPSPEKNFGSLAPRSSLCFLAHGPWPGPWHLSWTPMVCRATYPISEQKFQSWITWLRSSSTSILFGFGA